jgi:6-phosphogluconolactonase
MGGIMSVHWYSYPNAQAASEAAARHILVQLDNTLAGKEYATMAISGGSTPKLLFQELVKARYRWERVHLFWVDERAVPPTDPQSNYKLAEEFLITPAHFPRRNVHRIPAELGPERAAEHYVQEIRNFFQLEEGDLPHFDIIQQGMGPDAHTASLFPGEPLIDDREGIAAAVYVEKLKQWRITLLPGVLLATRHTLFLVCGEDKAEAVRAVFNDEYDPKRLPAQVVSHHGRSVAWFLDDAAGRLLRKAV